jgi:hypothetical protein
MKCLRAIWQGGKVVLFTVAGWLVAQGTALAQIPPKKAEPEGGLYVAAYAIVILAIALGMLFVCRTAARRDRAKPEVYDEIKIKPED